MYPGRQILVVDDDAFIRDVLRFALAEEGYDALTAPHGRAALAIVEHARPDLILLDLRMPVMDGWAFARAYRATTADPAPIVAMTAAVDAARWAAEIAADGVLAKPFDLDELFRIAREHTARIGAHARAA